jgi:recombination protein RecR
MDIRNYPSKLLEDAVNEFAKLPGIGNRTALRLVLYLLKQNIDEVSSFGNSILNLRNEIKYCSICNNISDTDICNICSNSERDRSLICVVENVRDVMAIEFTQQFKGIYHVLGGIISPMDGVGPADLKTDTLEMKVSQGQVKEVIFALNTTMEGDTTNFFLYRKLSRYPVKITTIARGVSIGGELEYTDEVTLGRSIICRTEFEPNFTR